MFIVEYGVLEGDLLKTLDYNLIVHTLFGPIEILKKRLLSEFSEESQKKIVWKLNKKARLTFLNNWIFVYPPGVMALGVFKNVIEQEGLKDFESLISKDEEIFNLWKGNQEKVAAFLEEFGGFDFKESENAHLANEVIELCINIKKAREAVQGGDNFQYTFKNNAKIREKNLGLL